MAENENFPELLRQRLTRRRQRFKLVLASLGGTVCAAVVVFFLMARTAGVSASARTLFATAGPGDSAWLIDQTLPVAGQSGENQSSFRLIDETADGLKPGPSFGGQVISAARVDDNTLVVTTPSRLLRFARAGDTWKLEESDNLGLNDTSAGPVCITLGGDLWLFYMRGPEVMARPALKPEVEPAVVFKAASPLTRVVAVGAGGTAWLALLEGRTGQLTLIATRPKVGDGKASVEVLRKAAVPGTAARCSLAVFGNDANTAVPVVALTRKDDASRAWLLTAWVASSKPEGEWIDVPAPPRAGTTSSLELTSFTALMARDGKLIAWFSEAGAVKRTEATWKDPSNVTWAEPSELELDQRGGMDALVWGAVLFGLGLLMTSQFVWLVLNRDRPQDRAITALLQRGGGSKPAPKPESKLVFASGPARAFALFIDLALTSPIVILLQGVYEYRWEDAYGFIVLVNLGALETGIVQAIGASVVTLTVLVIYSLFCELMWGRTLGKALFRLRVVDLDGETPSPWRVVVRNVLKIVEMIHWTVLIIPLALMLFSGRQQRLGDLAGGTVVVVDVVTEESPDDIDI